LVEIFYLKQNTELLDTSLAGRPKQAQNCQNKNSTRYAGPHLKLQWYQGYLEILNDNIWGPLKELSVLKRAFSFCYLFTRP
jgi:hypothetical protein